MQTQTAVQPASTTVRHTESATILVVDGDTRAADTLSAELAGHHFQSIVAHSACGMFEQARRDKPQVIILDARLPDADGYVLAQQLQSDPELCDIPLIVLSSSVRTDITRRACSAGCQFVVRKPCDVQSLIVLIGRALAETH